ncbi:MAG: IS21 family transposase [Gemmatimonadaceae bacterium]|nr:IS21 family transposase [Gemmatimonadaceae bacterium]
MRQVAEALRLTQMGRSQREISRALGLAQSTVSLYLKRAQAVGLSWPLPAGLDEAALAALLFPRTETPTPRRPQPDWAQLHADRKRKGVTLQLLWEEYKATLPDGYQYTQFCHHYHAWVATLAPVLRQVHVAGEKAMVDWVGPTVPIVLSPHETRDAQLFVGCLGASHYLFVEPTWTQTLPDWITAHVRMLEAFGGVPALLVPDNTKTAVTAPCFYEPTVHATYADLATHYGTAILPARALHPRDKAKVETAVQIVEREILAPLRHHVFTSLAELRDAVYAATARVNARPFQKLAGSRASVCATQEQPALRPLRPLPPTPYELAEWRTAQVSIDTHVSVERHVYSVPYRLVGQTVAVRLTATMVELLHAGTRVAVHVRDPRPGLATTEPMHRPNAHQRHLEWTPSRLIAWGAQVGPATAAVVTAILARYPHPEQGYRACLGLLALKRRYTSARLEAACTRAQESGAMSYRSVRSILKTGLDTVPLGTDDASMRLPDQHAHVRGAAYYAQAMPETVC